MKVVPSTGRPIFIYIPHQTSEKSKLARLATMAIRAVLARRLCNDQRTAVLETAILPIKLSAHILNLSLLNISIYTLCKFFFYLYRPMQYV